MNLCKYLMVGTKKEEFAAVVLTQAEQRWTRKKCKWKDVISAISMF